VLSADVLPDVGALDVAVFDVAVFDVTALRTADSSRSFAA
jgi:hypothetical protein